MSMVRVVRVELVYIVKGSNEKAFNDGVASLRRAYAPNQGRAETISSCGVDGSSEAVCASHEAKIVVEGQ